MQEEVRSEVAGRKLKEGRIEERKKRKGKIKSRNFKKGGKKGRKKTKQGRYKTEASVLEKRKIAVGTNVEESEFS